MLNSSQKPFFGITDGNHIYSLDRDLDSLAQQTNEKDYKVTASANFRTPKDNEPPEKADYRMIEHVDDILQILRESKNLPEEEEDDDVVNKKKKKDKITYIVQKYDNLEAILWQLKDAGERPSINYMTGKLTWITLTVNKHTFVIKSQQMIDYAIDGSMEIQDATTYNRMHDAKMDFHY